MKNWQTTLFGCTAMALTALHVSGITFGHIGNSDYITFGAIACGAAWAWFCKDGNSHSTQAEVDAATAKANGVKP